MTLPYVYSNGTLIKSSEMNANLSFLDAIMPIGAIVPWAKTFQSRDSGTNSSTATNKLIQSGQNFITTVSVGNCVYNSTDGTFAYVTAVDSDTQLSLSANIFTATSKNFTIYSTPALSSNWVECNGQTLSDANSIFNGATIDNLNGASSGTKRFLRGSTTSGTTGGADSYSHSHLIPSTGSMQIQYGNTAASYRQPNTDSQSVSALPSYYEIVFIMRVK